MLLESGRAYRGDHSFVSRGAALRLPIMMLLPTPTPHTELGPIAGPGTRICGAELLGDAS